MSSIKAARLIVITGGPGAGKTALLEVAKRHARGRVAVLPESASLLFGGGFPRRTTDAGKRAAQRAIFHVQRELERLAVEDQLAPTILCDRGTVDGAAYWPGPPEELFAEMGTTWLRELARYAAVIHHRTPRNGHGYNHENTLRVESPEEATAADERILEAWSAHPRRFVIDSSDDFMEKVSRALEVIDSELVVSRA
jgi:predicted ATPase